MIATVTLNPAYDRTIYVQGLVTGDTNRVVRSETDAGGKGVNASRMLARLGSETVALGFVGGRTGRFIAHVLIEEGIDTHFVETQAETRTNIGVEDVEGGPPTTLNEKGGPILPSELHQLEDGLRLWAKKSRYVVLGGSIPEGVDKGVYQRLIKIAQAEGVRCILDADNEPLVLGMQAKPMMIKPNLSEAERLCERDLKTLDDVSEAASSLVARGIELVVISMGPEGAVAATNGEVWHAVPPDVEVVSTVGAGDSMVAGMVHALSQGKSLDEALTIGSAAGASTAMSTGADIGTRENFGRILPEVVVRRLR